MAPSIRKRPDAVNEEAWVSSSGSPLVVFRGEVVPREQATVSALSATAQYGVNVFEGIRAYWNSELQQLYIFRFADHIQRLRDSAAIVGFEFECSDSDILDVVRAAIHANEYRQDISLRVCLMLDSAGSWSDDARPSLLVAPMAVERVESELVGYKACISSWRRIRDDAMPARVKTGANYMSGRYAMLEARRAGYNMPLLLNGDGRLAEAPGASVLIVRHRRLIAPEITDGILEGVTRDTIIELARELSLAVDVRRIAGSELRTADEVLLCGSAVEIRHVKSLDGVLYNDGRPGPITRNLSARYQEAVRGRLKQHLSWNTPVYGDGVS